MAGDLVSLDGAGDVVVKFLDMIEKAAIWAFSPHGERKNFEEGLAAYKKSIEEDPTLTGLAKGARIARASKDLNWYIHMDCLNFWRKEEPLWKRKPSVKRNLTEKRILSIPVITVLSVL